MPWRVKRYDKITRRTNQTSWATTKNFILLLLLFRVKLDAGLVLFNPFCFWSYSGATWNFRFSSQRVWELKSSTEACNDGEKRIAIYLSAHRPIAHFLIHTAKTISHTPPPSFLLWLEYFLILLYVTEWIPFNMLLHFYCLYYTEREEEKKNVYIKGRRRKRKTSQEYKYRKHSHNYVRKWWRFSFLDEVKCSVRAAPVYIRFDSAY